MLAGKQEAKGGKTPLKLIKIPIAFTELKCYQLTIRH